MKANKFSFVKYIYKIMSGLKLLQMTLFESYQCMQYFRGSKQLYCCQRLGFLPSAQLLMHAIAHGGCTDTRKRVCTENPIPHRGLEPESVLRLAFQADALPTELSLFPFPFLCYRFALYVIIYCRGTFTQCPLAEGFS